MPTIQVPAPIVTSQRLPRRTNVAAYIIVDAENKPILDPRSDPRVGSQLGLDFNAIPTDTFTVKPMLLTWSPSKGLILADVPNSRYCVILDLGIGV